MCIQARASHPPHWQGSLDVGEVEHKAFITVRDDICSAPVLFAPDYSLVIRRRHDASDMGWGGYFYQEVPGELDSRGHQKQRFLLCASNAFKEPQLAWPVFYKESWVFVQRCSKGRYFLERTPLPFKMQGDQAAMKYLKQCQKGKISAWLCEWLWGLSWEWEYLPGLKNDIADALSRFPCVQWGCTNFHGSVNMWNELLKVLKHLLQVLQWEH